MALKPEELTKGLPQTGLQGGAGVNVFFSRNGELDAATLAALQQWTEQRAEQAIPSAVTPGQIVLPPMTPAT